MSQVRLLALVIIFIPMAALATNVSGVLSGNRTWTTAGNPWLLTGDVTIPAGSTLTILPGVQVTFASTDGTASGADPAKTELIIDGTLNALGSSTSAITFTATNAYGVRVQGSATFDYATVNGGLYGVVSAGTSTISHSTFQSATTECLRVTGGTTSFSQGNLVSCGQALVTTGGSTSLQSSVVRSSGVSARSLLAIDLGASASLVHNTVTANNLGAINVKSFTGSVELFDNVIASNGFYGLNFASTTAPTASIHHNDVWGQSLNYSSNLVLGAGSISANPLLLSSTNPRLTELSPARFIASDGTDMGALPYTGDPTPTLQGVLYSDRTLTGANTLAGDLTILPGVTLTLAPGATLLFAATDGQASGVDTSRTELIVDGTLNALGSSAAPITLTATSAYGVRVQGSLNFDYATLTGGLYGVISTGTATFNRSTVQGATIDCLRVTAGTTSFSQGNLVSCYRALGTTGGSTSLRYSVVRASGSVSYGVRAIELGASTSLVHNTLTANPDGAIDVKGFTGSVELFDNIVSSNGGSGIIFASSTAPTRTVHHNDVWGHTVWNYFNVDAGAGSILANPLLLSSTNPRLTELSPARFVASDGTDLGALPYTGDPTSTLQGVLYSDRTLTGANTLAGDLTILPGVTLTLAPGASLTFATTDGLGSGVHPSKTELIVDGTLNAVGSSAAPITLTATNAYGVRLQGSLNFDYASLTGGYYGVLSSGTATFNHSTVQGATVECLRVSGGTASFLNGTLQNCARGLITSGGSTSFRYNLVRSNGSGGSYHAVELGAPTSVVHNTFVANLYGGIIVISSPTFSGPFEIADNILVSNGSFGITYGNYPNPSVHHNDSWGHSSHDYSGFNSTFDPTYGNISVTPLFVSSANPRLTELSPVRLAASDGTDMGALPYTGDPTPTLQGALYSDRTLTGANTLAGDLTIRPGVTLTLAPGASLTFATTDALGWGVDPSKTELIVDGSLSAVGSSAAPVTLTATGAYGVRVQGSASFDSATVNGGLYGVVSSGASTLNHSTFQGATTECLRVTGGTTSFLNGTLQNCARALTTAGGSTNFRYNLVRASGSSSQNVTAVQLGANTQFIHNTVTANSFGGLRIENTNGALTSCDVADNIITSNGIFGIYGATIVQCVHHNDVWNHSVNYSNITPGAGSISADPLFLSGTDLSLQAFSPCRRIGSDGTDLGAFPYIQPPAASVVVAPVAHTLAVQDTRLFTATAYDASNKPIPDAVISWSANGSAGTISPTGLFTAGCTPGTYPGAVTATVEGLSASAQVTVTPGPAATLTVSPSSASLSVTGTQPFMASASDVCHNALPSAPISWSVVHGGGSISPSGLFTAGTLPGTFTDTIQATTGSLSTTASVTVNPGPIQTVTVTPASATLAARLNQQFTATATDAFGNTVPGEPSWSVSPTAAGTINQGGGFTAGTTAGTYPGAVIASLGGVSGSADVTIIQRELARIVLTPTSINIEPGGKQIFTARGEDANGDEVALTPSWSVRNRAGTITRFGLFTATATVGTYLDSVSVTSNGITATASVTVARASVQRVELSPRNPITVSHGTIAFSVKAFDASGAELSRTPSWEVVHGGGTIDASSGVFSAGAKSGSFTETLRVTVGGVSTVTSVTVEEDSDADGMGDAWEVANGLDPSKPGDGSGDEDGDGLSNLVEFKAGTLPRTADTDGDGLTDGEEDANQDGKIDPGERDPNRPELLCGAAPECGESASVGFGCSGSGAGASLSALVLLALLGHRGVRRRKH